MAHPNPLTYDEITMQMEVAVYIPGLRRPLYGVVKGKSENGKGKTRVMVEVFRYNRAATIEVDLDQIIP